MMNLKQIIRTPLLLVFVLLQCMAPFAHAHVNGQNADHHVHLAAADLHQYGDHQQPELRAGVMADDSQVVSMQPEFRTQKPDCSKAIIGTGIQPIVSGPLSNLRVAHFDIAPRVSFLPYHHPSAQAPPV